MEQYINPQEEYNQELEKVHDKDIAYSWVSSSAFLFYLSVFCMVAFLTGAFLKLYTHRYKGKPEVTVQESSLYTPVYK
ncbi:MAG: hypothetical protein ABIN57_06845 [Chitinophagaceae bacterium]